MWWDEFERQLTDTFNTYDFHERHTVHSDNQKLCILNRKVNADFLQDTKASINIELAKNPVMHNYDDSLTAFKNQVKKTFPPDITSSKIIITRRVYEVGFQGSGKGGRFQGRGRG